MKRNAFKAAALAAALAAVMTVGITMAAKSDSASGSAGTSVAGIDISASLVDNGDYYYNSVSDNNKIIYVDVENDSDVSVECNVIIELSEAVPLNIYCYDESGTKVSAKTDDNITYKIKDGYTFEAGEEKTVRLSIYCIPSDSADTEFTMSVSVIAEQGE